MFADLATSLLFHCAACRNPASARTFPLCQDCLDSLTPCPPLCPDCASPICPSVSKSCTRPWIAKSDIRSFTGHYLGTEPAYQILRAWKNRRGFLFDRLILRRPPRLVGRWFVVPIPQRFHRAWQLGGSPTETLARWIALKNRAPIWRALEIAHPSSGTSTRQSGLALEARLQNPVRLQIRPTLREDGLGEIATSPGRDPIRVLLIDDFMTSGHTLRAAAHVLHRALPGIEIHAYCLCLRPLLQSARFDAGTSQRSAFSLESGSAAEGRETAASA